MVLVRLIDQQIADHWDVIKFAMKESLPPTAEDTEEIYNNLLQALLLGKMQCWTPMEGAELKQFRTLITTHLVDDSLSQTKNLILYTAYAFVPISDEDGVAIYKGLAAFGKANKCNRVIGLTNNIRMAQWLTKHGMKEEWRYFTFDL